MNTRNATIDLIVSIAVLLPHLGSATERTRYDMADIAALNILAGIDGQPMFAPVP